MNSHGVLLVPWEGWKDLTNELDANRRRSQHEGEEVRHFRMNLLRMAVDNQVGIQLEDLVRPVLHPGVLGHSLLDWDGFCRGHLEVFG